MTLRDGAAATGLFLGGLGIAAAVAVVTAPISPRVAVAQTVEAPAWRAGSALQILRTSHEIPAAK